jgi:hypothetical protein
VRASSQYRPNVPKSEVLVVSGDRAQFSSLMVLLSYPRDYGETRILLFH